MRSQSRQAGPTGVAGTAPGPARRCSPGTGQRSAIDDLVAKADVAAEQQCGAARALVEGALRSFQRAGDAEKLRAVRHLDRLDEDLARLG